VNAAGPIPDPWIMLAEMLAAVDSSPLNTVRWAWSQKNSTIQL